MSAAPVPGSAGGAVVFTDIVGFTEFTAERGDTDALALLDQQERVVRGTLPPDARVVKELGDGLMLWFPDPVAALDACLELRDRFEHEASDTAPLWVRIGMHWGTPSRRGDDLVGHDVNVAARIVALAGPGELLISDAARTRTEGRIDGVDLEELGPVMMKGIPGSMRLFRASRSRIDDRPRVAT
jgi:adenylate cyclase